MAVPERGMDAHRYNQWRRLCLHQGAAPNPGPLFQESGYGKVLVEGEHKLISSVQALRTWTP